MERAVFGAMKRKTMKTNHQKLLAITFLACWVALIPCWGKGAGQIETQKIEKIITNNWRFMKGSNRPLLWDEIKKSGLHFGNQGEMPKSVEVKVMPDGKYDISIALSEGTYPLEQEPNSQKAEERCSESCVYCMEDMQAGYQDGFQCFGAAWENHFWGTPATNETFQLLFKESILKNSIDLHARAVDPKMIGNIKIKTYYFLTRDAVYDKFGGVISPEHSTIKWLYGYSMKRENVLKIKDWDHVTQEAFFSLYDCYGLDGQLIKRDDPASQSDTPVATESK